ncbi:MAG: Tad domain-containing protein [Aggregatilineales bacterium]
MKAYRSLKNRKAQSGQAIVIITLSMALLLAIVALGIDGSKFYSERRVAQNAADESALAGIYLYSTNLQNNVSTTDKQVLSEVERVAELDQIADTSDGGGTVDDDNPAVLAWWLKNDGTQIGQIPSTSPADGAAPPSNATAIRVQVQIPYPTFLGGFVGHATVTAQASADARIVLNTVPPLNTFPPGPYIGGGECNNLTTAIAFNYWDAQNAGFPGGFSVNGSLNVGTEGGRTQTGGNITVTGPAGNFGVQITPNNANPFSRMNGIPPNSYTYLGAAATQNPAPYPYFWKINGVKYTIDAAWFNPNATSGVWGTGISPYLKALHMAGDPAGPVVYIPGDPGAQTAINSWIAAHPLATSGVFYVDGDLSTGQGWSGFTLITKGTFTSTGNNQTYGTAGPYAMNLSVLAGADLETLHGTPVDASGDYYRCASNPADAVLTVLVNHNDFDGVIYVPYGQSYFGKNSHVGGTPAVPGLVTYSYRLGEDPPNKANNWQFTFLPNLPALPSIITQLMGN